MRCTRCSAISSLLDATASLISFWNKYCRRIVCSFVASFTGLSAEYAPASSSECISFISIMFFILLLPPSAASVSFAASSAAALASSCFLFPNLSFHRISSEFFNGTIFVSPNFDIFVNCFCAKGLSALIPSSPSLYIWFNKVFTALSCSPWSFKSFICIKRSISSFV